MKLSRNILNRIHSSVLVPDDNILQLPEKVLQFGTGVLLRALPDYFIDKANRQGIFQGRIVVVKSTSKGDLSSFHEQDCLYTVCVRGLQNGKKVEENIINSSISRVLHADTDWDMILECAHNKNMQIIISNTTEVGITLVNEDILNKPPLSYPGKLLAFLYERFKALKGADDSGFIILPTELIPDNGNKLESIVLELSRLNNLDGHFIEWLLRCNYFCSSLVDRIVTGTPVEKIKNAIEDELGYADDLLTFCEVYSLWAIEGNEHIKKVLSFAKADQGMVIAPDIALYRELKLRLLNATHTMSCGIAILADIPTVKDAMDDVSMGAYIAALMQKEIGWSIPYKIPLGTIRSYTGDVLDRFRNPHVDHYWKKITLNYTSKIRLRCVPLLSNYYQENNAVPELLSLGFAAYIFFMKGVSKNDSAYFGEFNNQKYLIEDENAEKFYHLWSGLTSDEVVERTLKDVALWGTDLTRWPGFSASVIEKLNTIISDGMKVALEKTLEEKIKV